MTEQKLKIRLNNIMILTMKNYNLGTGEQSTKNSRHLPIPLQQIILSLYYPGQPRSAIFNKDLLGCQHYLMEIKFLEFYW